MLGRKKHDQLELLMTGSLRQLVPDDHILARVDRVLDQALAHRATLNQRTAFAADRIP